MKNTDEELRLWTTSKDKNNSIGYFVFHVFGKVHGFYDWWATLTVDEQTKCRDSVVSIIKSVNGRS